MSDLHEAVFKWPYNANEAIVTGTFDQWSRSIRMKKGPTGFTAIVPVPWEQRVLYKFIVDGRWSTIDQAPTEVDPAGNVNNVYHAPAKPKKLDTSRYESHSTQTPTREIASVPVKKEQALTPPQPVQPAKPEQPVKDKTPVVPANGIKPVNTPPAKTEKVPAPDNVPAVLPTPANLKSPLVIVPVNDANAADKKPPVVQPPKDTDTPSTHALPINSPRKASTGTSSSNTLPVEKKEEERREPEPEKVKQPNGTTNGTTNGVVRTEEPANQPPATPVKDRSPTIPATPATPPKFASPPTTPKKSYFPGSPSSSAPSSPNNSISKKGSLKKKRDSFLHRVKHIFTPEKEKKEHHHKEPSHD